MSWGEAWHTLQVILVVWLLVGLATGCLYALLAVRMKRRSRR